MSTKMSSKPSLSTKVLIALLLAPLVFVVVTKDPEAAATTVGKVVAGGATLLNWLAERISDVLHTIAQS